MLLLFFFFVPFLSFSFFSAYKLTYTHTHIAQCQWPNGRICIRTEHIFKRMLLSNPKRLKHILFIHVSCNQPQNDSFLYTHSQCVCIAITLDNSINSILKSLWHASRIPTTRPNEFAAAMAKFHCVCRSFMLKKWINDNDDDNDANEDDQKKKKSTCICVKRDGFCVCVHGTIPYGEM